MGAGGIGIYSYEDLAFFTDNFSESKYIGHFQFGKFYRGKGVGGPIKRDYIVKIWEIPESCNYEPGDNEVRLLEEIILYRHELLTDHPCMLKLYGYCDDGQHLGTLYVFKPLDSLFYLIPKGCFTWLQRIKAALGLASLLTYLHDEKQSEPFVIHNLDAAHIIIGEDYTPKLCDLGSIGGRIFPDRTAFLGHDVRSCYGCIDFSNTGRCSSKQDVFAFGVILLSLISKRVYTEEDMQAGVPFIHDWALEEFDANVETMNGFSLVDKTLAAEDEFCYPDGHEITMVALQCVGKAEHERPPMNQVFDSLLKLEVVKQCADFLEVDKFQRPCGNAL